MSRRSATRLFVSLAVLACLAWGGAAHAVAYGYVQTTIEPPGAAAAGAQWRVNGGPWQNSGALYEISYGEYALSFKPIPGWRAPANQTVQVSPGVTTPATGIYLAYDLCEGVGACNRAWTVSNGSSGGESWFVQEEVSHDSHNALRSGAVAPDQSSSLQTTVEGPCTVSFWWKSSCADGTAQYFYVIDGVRQNTLTGEVDWNLQTRVLEEGSHVIYWTFFRGAGDPGGGSNCGWLDQFLVAEAVPPTGSITVNGGAEHTNTPFVQLDLTYADAGAGVTGMRFSSNGSTWSPWQKPAPTKLWDLSPGDGMKINRAQFRDKAGNVSVRYTDNILLDETPPTGTIVINGGAGITPSRIVTLGLTWDDGAGSGVSRMRFSDDGATWSPWEAPAPTKEWMLPGWGYRTVRVQYLDRAGNVSERYSDYINVVS